MHTYEKAASAGTERGQMGLHTRNSTTTGGAESFSLAAPDPFTPPAPQQIQERFDALTAGGWTQAGIVAEVRKRGVKLDPGDFSNARRGRHGKRLSRAQWQAIESLPVDHRDDAQAGTEAGPRAGTQATERMAQARRFLAILDPEADCFTFQTFDDTEAKRGRLAQTIVGDLDRVWSRLEQLNQAGAGVFVTVNVTQGQTRRAVDVVRVRACFADFDPPKTASAPALADYPLAPTMLVETSPGRQHAYWPVDGLDIDSFKPAQQAIAARLRSDPAPHDLPRVMRLPGFYHCKDPAHRHLVRVAWTDERQPYSAEQVRAAFGVNGHQHQVQTTEVTERTALANDDILEQLLSGASVHASALHLVGRMVADGMSTSMIRSIFKALAPQVAAARGTERASILLGSELDRMIDGARAKGYGDAAAVDISGILDQAHQATGGDAVEQLTVAEAERLVAWCWSTGTALPDPRDAQQHFERVDGKGKKTERLRVGLGVGSYSAPWIKLAFQARTRADFLAEVDQYLPRREELVLREAERTGKPPQDMPSDQIRSHAEQWMARVAALSVPDDEALALRARAEQWPDLEPLVSITGAEAYPLDALPERVRAAVVEVQAFVKAPLPLVATSALSALSVAIQAHVDVARAEKLKGPTSLFSLVIADSGERKTTVDGFFTAAIREYEAKQLEAMRPELENYVADLASWQSEKEGYLAGIRQASKVGKQAEVKKYRLALQDLEHSKPAEPRVPRLLRGDDTPEALAWSLAKGWPSAGVLSSEAGVIFGAHGMGKDSVMRNLALLNVLWDGGQHDIGRRTSESFTVKGARFTVGLMVQEQTLRDYFERAGALARGSGFLARFLVCWPESTQGVRFFTEAPATWPALARFNSRLAGILESPVVPDDEGRLSPHLLTLTPEAKALWVRFHDAIEAELAPSGELFEVRDVASKVADNAARLAALLHVFERTLAEPIGLDLMERATRIVAWHLSESRRFFSELAVPEATLAAAQLERWLVGYCREQHTDTVARRDVQRLVIPAQLRHGETLTEAVKTLAEHGRVRERSDGKRKLLQVRAEVLEG